MRTSYKLFTLLLAGALLVVPGCDDNGTEPDAAGALEGTWKLTALSGTYTRDVALPDNWTDPDSFVVKAHWDLGVAILQANASLADLELVTFFDGDVLLDTTVVFPNATILAAVGIAMTANFLEDGKYTLSGTYPAIRLDKDACRSALTILPITDNGTYTMNYNTAETGGTLELGPDIGEQVLPPFPDGAVTFSNNGGTLQLDFTDRDSHDERYIEVMDTWSEADDRVMMGIADLPINSSGAFATSGSTVDSSAYIQDPLLAGWGSFLTFYALAIQFETTYLATAGILTDLDSDGDIDVVDGIIYITMNRSTGTSQLLLPYSLLVATDGTPTNDSDRDFDAANPALGGKLTYIIDAVCIPVNELIIFESTWTRVQ